LGKTQPADLLALLWCGEWRGRHDDERGRDEARERDGREEKVFQVPSRSVWLTIQVAIRYNLV
jgi:hypothetical protein